MHLEDRLQELYFKSKMLSEYLKGQMRVHVKELGVVLGYDHKLPQSSAALGFLVPNPPPGFVLSTENGFLNGIGTVVWHKSPMAAGFSLAIA